MEWNENGAECLVLKLDLELSVEHCSETGLRIDLGFVLELDRGLEPSYRSLALELDWELSCANGLGKELGTLLRQGSELGALF